MNILITNDDGCEAPGLRAAYEAVRPLGRVYVAAPAQEQSGCSHRLTLRGPLVVERRTNDLYGAYYAVHGTPADSVRVALAGLLDAQIDVVVAGINQGANTGVDVFYSGTVAGAREGAIYGKRAIAVSQAVRRDLHAEVDWAASTMAAEQLIRLLLTEALPGPGFWNINLPAPVPKDVLHRVHRVPISTDAIPVQYERRVFDEGNTLEFDAVSNYWERPSTEPTDFTVVRDGHVAVTAVSLDHTFG